MKRLRRWSHPEQHLVVSGRNTAVYVQLSAIVGFLVQTQYPFDCVYSWRRRLRGRREGRDNVNVIQHMIIDFFGSSRKGFFHSLHA